MSCTFQVNSSSKLCPTQFVPKRRIFNESSPSRVVRGGSRGDRLARGSKFLNIRESVDQNFRF